MTATIATSGELVLSNGNLETRLPVDALPDSRIQVDERGQLLILSSPSDRYAHGVLGDSLEATAITLIETKPSPRVLSIIPISPPDVIEGISALWTDINADGEREIIVTLSNDREGARLAVFREDGSLLAQGASVGTAFRWRHQLLVAPFGEANDRLLAVVRTPHIGGVLEFYRLNGSRLEIVAERPGISTHSIGSRNLHMAQAGDFDEDGYVELLAPDQSHTRLGIVSLDDPNITWIPLNAELITNLATVHQLATGEIAIAGGLSNNTLRIWIPESE
jgi:hypothetical protein